MSDVPFDTQRFDGVHGQRQLATKDGDTITPMYSERESRRDRAESGKRVTIGRSILVLADVPVHRSSQFGPAWPSLTSNGVD